MSTARLAFAAAAVGVILLSGCAPTEPEVTLTDSKGRHTLVPADKIAYVEIGGGVAGTVGFRS